MSGIALIWAANVKGLKPAAKIVLIQLADFHNKETGQCNPSAQRLADECEMDRATAFRHLSVLEEKGLLTRHSRGDGKGGRGSNQYDLHLDVVLGPSSKRKEKSQNATGGKVAKNGGKGRNGATGVVAICDTNLTIEPVKEPSVAAPQTFSDFFEDFLEAHPRPKNQDVTEELFTAAVEGGVDPADLLRAARIYAEQQEGNSHRHKAGSDSWLRNKGYVDALRGAPAPYDPDAADAQIADTIKTGKPFLCTNITSAKARSLIERGMVTPQQCQTAGMQI